MVLVSRPSPSTRSRRMFGTLLVLASNLLGCSDTAGHELDAGARADVLRPPPECDARAPNLCPDTIPSWAHVQPIFTMRCAVCHGQELGLWPLNEYSLVVDWNVEIRAMVLDCTMPPPDSDVTMTLEERQLVLEWISCGFPR